ncbi:hypothetical protein C8Q77DRAFT_123949 [Trametes polyzona]|nr:hypothetical protein C8Q77DRAFT_123949 [Trametes polyzona]
MRAGILSALFFSALFVQARPAPDSEQKRDRELTSRDTVDVGFTGRKPFAVIDNITKAAEEIFSSDIAPILHEVTPEVGTLVAEATSALGSVFASNTALGHEATAILSAFESKATTIEHDVAAAVKSNDAPQVRSIASGSLHLGLATALGSVLLGAYAVL